VKDHRPLLIWDSLVEFHTGDEQSSTATRKFMRNFRELANLGATVVILHHTGKSESSQDYRGSSDIKAAVDMAYKLDAQPKGAKSLEYLTLNPFKCRMASVPGRKMRFVAGEGFQGVESIYRLEEPKPDPLLVVKRIVRDNPGLNQGDIVERAKADNISKHAVEDALKDPEFQVTGGAGNTKHYTLRAVEPPQEVENAAA
jgi:hypothetical protein